LEYYLRKSLSLSTRFFNTMASMFDVAAVREHFPALNQQQVFMDNAGGSQVLGSVINSISSYLSTTNVQLGATYPVAQKSTNAYGRGVEERGPEERRPTGRFLPAEVSDTGRSLHGANARSASIVRVALTLSQAVAVESLRSAWAFPTAFPILSRPSGTCIISSSFPSAEALG